MNISHETADAILEILDLKSLAMKTNPDMPIRDAFGCACSGPLPECRCARRDRLLAEFARQVRKATK